eukprot:gene10328-10485_t
MQDPKVKRQSLETPAFNSRLSEEVEKQLLPPSLKLDPSHQPLLPRKLTCEEGQEFYLSYGANMSPETLLRRSVKVLQRVPCAIVDANVHLSFRHRGGYATLVKGDDQPPKFKSFMPQVHGVLFLLEKDEMKKLQKREGGYELQDVEVVTYDGWTAKAKAFVSTPLALLPAEVVPTEKYMKTLRVGAAENFLDPLYQAYLSSITTVPSVGLGPEYWNTPSKYLAYGFLSIVALVVVGFFAQH